uniref:Uncharacterized protein n=1 Tax=Nothoprocta perdicaria TaxID=30464 RepID=A0A8C6ZUZ9_NOTPE
MAASRRRDSSRCGLRALGKALTSRRCENSRCLSTNCRAERRVARRAPRERRRRPAPAPARAHLHVPEALHERHRLEALRPGHSLGAEEGGAAALARRGERLRLRFVEVPCSADYERQRRLYPEEVRERSNRCSDHSGGS